MPVSQRTYNYSGDYELTKCNFVTREGASYDFKAIFAEIHFYEDIFAPSTSIDLVIIDALDLINNLDIAGGEKLVLHFVTAGMDKGVEVELLLYKVSPPMQHNEKTNVSTFHFCSKEKLKNSMVKISQSYDGTIAEIVPKVIKNYLDSDKDVFIDETRDIRHVVVPRWKPFYFINWLSKRAVSSENNGASYLFYETAEGFNFRSLDSLINPEDPDNAPRKTLNYTSENLSADSKSKDSFHNIKILDIKSNTNILESIESGLYGSTVETFDLLKKKRYVDDYKYRRDFAKFKHLEPNSKTGGIGDMYLIGNEQDYDDYPEARYVFAGLNYSAWDNYSGDYSRNWVNSRNTYLQSISQILIDVTVDGDTSLHIGDKVDITIPSNTSIDVNDFKNKKLSGTYLVTALRHTMTKEKLVTTLELSKDTWGTPLKS